MTKSCKVVQKKGNRHSHAPFTHSLKGMPDTSHIRLQPLKTPVVGQIKYTFEPRKAQFY